MKVILSSGIGPIHFVSSAQSISRCVDRLSFVCGYVPKKSDTLLLRVVALLRKKSIRTAIKKRQISDGGFLIRQCIFAEALCQMILIIGRFNKDLQVKLMPIAWKIFGLQSRRYIKDADIFHVRSGAGHGGAIKKAKKLGMRVVVDHSIAHPDFMDRNLREEFVRNGEKFTLGMKNPFWKMIDDECKEADIVQVNSNFVKQTFVEAGYDPDRVRVVHLGVREDFWGLRKTSFKDSARQDSPLRLLFTGGFGFRKGAEYILDACRILKELRIDYEMSVVGEYMTSIDLMSRFKQYHLPITFHGPVPQDELKSFLENSDIYVFPSLAEGCAQSGMEAMAAGLCVIGTYESGFPITDGVNGYIVPSKSSISIAEKISWLNAHRKEIDRVGENATHLIRNRYSWNKYAQHTCELYEELMSR